VHVPTVADASLAPEGKDIVYILIPVPNLHNRHLDRSHYEDRMRRVVFTKIRRYTGIDLEEAIETEYKFYPEDYMTRYNIKYGAAFGLSHSFFQSAFFRPPNFDRKIKNLYFVGASTQPGGGLPPVLASSRIVADLIKERYPAGN
jgi:phytoene desaturase